MFQDQKVLTGNLKETILRGVLLLPLILFISLSSCGKHRPEKKEGYFYLTKGQAIQQVKLYYPDLAKFQECSRPPDEICSWEDIFIFDDPEKNEQYDLVFRDGNGRIEKIGLEKEVFLVAYYYYFTVTKSSGDVVKKGTFEKKLLQKTENGALFECSGKTFWGIPVTSDCSVFH